MEICNRAMPMGLNSFIRKQSPAKINLFLHVIEKWPSGFHRLQSIFSFIPVGDYVEITPSPHFSFNVSGPFSEHLLSSSGVYKNNLVLKAVDFFSDFSSKYKIFIPSFSVQLEKNIPLSSGLGGGSSNAATIISLLCDSFLPPLSEPEKWKLVKESGILGADVPVCLAHQLGLGNFFWLDGSGNEGELIPILPNLFSFKKISCVLVNPLKSVSTGTAFSNIQNFSAPIICDFSYVLENLTDYHNDFEPSVSQSIPEILDILNVLESFSPLLTRMSGSGATCFALFSNPQNATCCFEKIKRSFPNFWHALSLNS